jgi:type I restriction enzyme M protein
MGTLSARSLADRLEIWAGDLFGRAETSEVIGIIAAMLLIKRASDQPGIINIPFQNPLDQIARSEDAVSELNKLLERLDDLNSVILDNALTSLPLPKSLRSVQVRRLADEFNGLSLRDSDLELDGTVGESFDRFLLSMAERAGKRDAEIFTPPAVTDLMVQIVSPTAGDSIYDPFVGVGSFLVAAREYVRENYIDSVDVNLFGQEINVSTWAIAKINLVLHGVSGDRLFVGDTLARPEHIELDGRLTLFDRILTHAPFSMSYDKKQIKYPERMRYGWTSEHGRADLLNIQHVLAVLAPRGTGALLTTLGVLFRGGAEGEIRKGMLYDHRIAAVIALGPGILSSTSIPSCILVLRNPGSQLNEEGGSVHFINAENEVIRGRGSNRIGPGSIEKIVEAFQNRADIPGFSRIAPMAEIANNDFNLSVRLYVDRELPAQIPVDAKALINGGIPISEVAAESEKFRAFGVDPFTLFHTGNAGYLDFPSESCEVTVDDIMHRTKWLQRQYAAECQSWWDDTRSEFTRLADHRRLLSSRTNLIDSFQVKLGSAGILDRYELGGIFAVWWSTWRDDFRIVEQRGFHAAINRWRSAGIGPGGSSTHDSTESALDFLGEDLCKRTEALVSSERQRLAEIYRSWNERYGTSLLQLTAQAQDGRHRLESRFRELGYVARG